MGEMHGDAPSDGGRGSTMAVAPAVGIFEGHRQANVRPPLERRGMVRRTRLLARLDAVPQDVPLILLAAPAGYGKTTALSQWAASSERPFAWVTLDAADGDPSWLAAHIALAVHDAAPVPAETVETLTTSGNTRRGGVLPRLLQLVGETQRPTVLVLDDLHEVRGRESLMLVR